MKILVLAFILLGCEQLVCAVEIPPWHVIKATERGAKMIKIVEAVWAYQARFKKRPPSLSALVSTGFLKEEDLCLKSRNGAPVVPDYYPNPAANVLSNTVVIRAPSEDGSYQIIVREDLSIDGVANKNEAERDSDNPATAPQSKPSGNENHNPDSKPRP